ncbi:MAG: VWA domain-containing protein [Fervidobacterium sp.]|nr:VWA domain-containing protein [Fervidobacterium sp.]
MKKSIILCIIFVTTILILYSCSNIPTAPSTIPKDPAGTTKPNVSSYSTIGIYAVVDKQPTLLPIAVPDYVKLRVSVPGFESLSPSNFRVFEDNKEQGFVVYKESTVKNKIDIAIILDVTGSMSPSIQGAKNSIIAFSQALKDSGLDVRIGVVPFDDYVNPPSDIEIEFPYLDLSSPDKAKDYVSELYAGFGGDTPENPYDAIMFAATALEWRVGSQKSMIIITDAPAHYKGDGTSFAHFTKSELLPYLVGYFTIHGAFVPGSFYSTSASSFSAENDPREICQKTGGVITYTDSYGNVDLTALGIVEYVESSWIVAFESDSSAPSHTIEVFFEAGTTKKYTKLENVTY